MNAMFIQMLGGLFHLFSQYKLKLIQFKIICHFHQMTENTNKNLLLQPEYCSALDNVCWYPRWPELFLKTVEKGGKTESIKLSKSYNHGLISPVGTRFNLPGRAPSGTASALLVIFGWKSMLIPHCACFHIEIAVC